MVPTKSPVLSRNLLPVWGSAPKIEIKIYKSEKNVIDEQFFLNFAQRSYLRSSRGVHNLGVMDSWGAEIFGGNFFYSYYFLGNTAKNGGFWCRIWTVSYTHLTLPTNREV